MRQVDIQEQNELRILKAKVKQLESRIERQELLLRIAQGVMITVAMTLVLATAFLVEQTFLPFLKTL